MTDDVSEGIMKQGKIHSGIQNACLVAVLLLSSVWHVHAIDPVLEPYADRVDTAVNRGLKYLAGVQTQQGFFPGGYGRSPGVVSLVGMAFLAVGHTPGSVPYRDTLDRCIDYVLSQQQANGAIATRSGNDRTLYSHNISTLFLMEVSGMVDAGRQKKLDEAIPRAVKLILAAQQVAKPQGHAGGWRYEPNSGDSDLSCSGWALLALRAARLNGVQVPDKAIDDAVKYVLKNRNAGNGGFGYQGTSPVVGLSGAALLCLELTGHHGDESTLKAGQYILSGLKALQSTSQYEYDIYYCAQGMFQLGGVHWERFAQWMYEYWLPRQKADGSWLAEPGSWAAGSGGGTYAYTTSMMLLSLTVPYRQLPIYQRDETVNEE